MEADTFRLTAYSKYTFEGSPDESLELSELHYSLRDLDSEIIALCGSYPIVMLDGDIIVRLGIGHYLPLRPIPGHDGIRPFAIGKYPITQIDYSAMNGVPALWPVNDRLPIVKVSATEAEEILKKYKLRLPSDPEWQLAAYGIDGRTYPWGGDPPTNEHMIWSGSGIKRSGPECVGRCRAGASPFGVEDMLGNVWEWASTSEDGYRVLRGGGWSDDDPSRVRAGYRSRITMTVRINDVGFRCAMDL